MANCYEEAQEWFYEIATELDLSKRPKWTSKDEAWEEETTISAANAGTRLKAAPASQ